jgi:hypothetical protein
MKILSIGKNIQDDHMDIENIDMHKLCKIEDISQYRYILISGGDGTIRRVVKALHKKHINLPPFILNPIGSFNVIAKQHKVPNYKDTLKKISENTTPDTNSQKCYSLNKEIFLFSAGNMGDLQHIFLSETFRFGILEKGMGKYLIAGLFLLPVHLLMTPFMLLSSKRFFIFTPASFIHSFGSFKGRVEKEIKIDLQNTYNLLELDGDIVMIEENLLSIQFLRSIEIVK